MSEPIFVLNELAFDGSAMTQNLDSQIFDLAETGGFAVHSVFTGSPVGLLTVSGSNTLTVSDFVSIDDYSITASGKRMLNVEQTQYRYVLVQYTFTSGTGSLTSRVSGKRK